jgi:5-methylcytosine-specific restriction endonuclease McrA
MGKRQNEWAARVRQKLIEQLGGKCTAWGDTDPEKLEFDHINGRYYIVNELSSSHRMSVYRREAAAGELRLLCSPCNLAARKQDDNGRFVPTGARIPKTSNIPF